VPELLRVPGTSASPELVFHSSPTYALYHWLRANSGRPPTDDRLRPAFRLMHRSVNPLGVRGMVEAWEGALASGESADQSLHAFQARVKATGDEIVMAMRSAERIFLEEHWPEREERIRRTVDAIEAIFAPAFPAMASEHADLLSLKWPVTLDVHLVADCAEPGGAYSHPLTIDVSQNTGTWPFETILHEATHVADVHGRSRGHRCLGDRLQAWLGEHGVPARQRFNAWHAVIFASSAACTRHHIDLGHEDYARSRQLYAFFGVPNVARLWREFSDGGRDEAHFREALLGDLRSH
jgi:hypothetical protein